MGQAAADDASPLSLLAGTALLALRGTPPEWTNGRPAPASRCRDTPPPSSAASSAPAGPTPTSGEFRAALAAVADKPAETTRPRRLAHVALLAAFLSFGLCSGLAPVAFIRPGRRRHPAPERVRVIEAYREGLHEVADRDAADAQPAAEPAQRPRRPLNPSRRTPALTKS